MPDFDNVSADKILTRYDILADAKDKPETIAERILPKDPVLRKVAEDVVFLKAKNIQDDVTEALKTVKPEQVIEGGLLKGMDVVAELYGRGIYYLPHVMVASDAMDKSVEENKPQVVTGTALMTTTMSAFPKIAERLQERGINIPFICAGGAVNRSYVESYPLGVYAEKAANGPGLVNKATAGWDWRKIRDNWDAIQAGKV